MNLLPILPEITLLSGALLVLMLDVFLVKKFKNIFYLSHLLALITIAATTQFVVQNFAAETLTFHNMFISCPFTSFSKLIALALLALFIVLSLDFVAVVRKVSAEFLALVMIATAGGMILISANDFLVFYLGLELQALPLYILAAFNRNSSQSSEAGIKYFILGSLASGILLFGISMIYGFSGTVNFTALTNLYHDPSSTIPFFTKIPVGVMFGFIMVLVAIFFKISAAPFHMWAPDVYQGAPTIVASFFGTVVKFTTIIALIKLVAAVVISWPGISKVFLFAAMLSIFIGSFGALFQKNFKRLLAYSSISHVGFILLAMVGFYKTPVAVCVLYAVTYAAISFGSFAFLNLMKKANDEDDEIVSDEDSNKIFAISSLSGLAKVNPFMAAALTVLMFSSAGIPPLAGFFSKFYVIYFAIGHGSLPYAIVAVLLSVVSAFYYLRIVKIMYFDEPNSAFALKDSFSIKFLVILSAIINLLMFFVVNDLLSLLKSFSVFVS